VTRGGRGDRRQGRHGRSQPQSGAAVRRAFAKLAKTTNTLILPASAGDVAGMVATAMTVLDKTKHVQAAVKGA
jgi:hypothetical protein